MTQPTLRRVVRLQRGAGFPHDEQGHLDGELPFFKVSDFGRHGNERWLRSCQNWISYEASHRLRAVPAPSGSVLLPKIGAALLGNARRLTTRWCVFDNNVLAVVPSAVDSRYLYYWLAIVDLAELAQPGPVPSLDDSALLDLRLPVHSVGRQRAIAGFLDTQTARIDALIDKKRRLIELLDARYGATIDEALSDIREHVSTRHMVSRLTSGPRGWSDRGGDFGQPFFRITNIDRRSINLDYSDLLRVADPGTAEADRTRVRAGDVLVSITADIGSVAVAGTDDHGGFVSQHVALMTPVACEGEWLAYAIKGTRAQEELDAGQYGGTKTQLSLSDIADLKVPCPSADERRRRLGSLRRKHESIESARRAIAAQVVLLQEHRQALITAAVTGEMEVPGVAV